MHKAEVVSKEIYSYKKNREERIENLNYLRLAFFLNKYFGPPDIEEINKYFSTLTAQENKYHHDLKAL